MNKFSVAGIGPGHRDYILPVSLKVIESSDLLIGGRRQLDHFLDFSKRELVLKGNYPEVFEYIKENKDKELENKEIKKGSDVSYLINVSLKGRGIK